MTASDPQLLLRAPTWARAWVAVFPALFAAFVVLAVRPDPLPVRAGTFVMVALVVLLAWRLFRLAAIGTPDGVLVVRNHWRDRTLERSAITAVGISRVRGGTGNLAVQLTVQDGSSVRLDVTEVPFRAFFGRRLERDAATVRAWVSGDPQPYR